MDDVRQFVIGALTASGAAIEESADTIYAVLPAAEVSRLQLGEELRVSFGAEPVAGAIAAHLGSPLLERLVADRLERPALAAVAVPGRLPRALPDRLPVLRNAVRAGAVEHARLTARYLMTELEVTLQGDDMRRRLQSLCVRLADGARVDPVALAGAYAYSAEPLDDDERDLAGRALRSWMVVEAPAAMDSALTAVARRARRDLERLADYFGSLDGEMWRAVKRARSTEEKERRREKREGLGRAMAARREQLRERLRPRLSARLLAAILVETEVDRFAVPVRRRSQDGLVSVLCRAADHAFEGPACGGCGVATLSFFLCDQKLHVLCEECGQEGRIDAVRCTACGAGSAPPVGVSIEDPTRALRLGG